MDKHLDESDALSIWVHSAYPPLLDSLHALRGQSKGLLTDFDQFRENTICYVNQMMGKITSSMHREISAKKKVEQELQIVKNSNTNMRNQVIQLREMIEEFVKGYNAEIQFKNNQIMQLRKQLGKANPTGITDGEEYLRDVSQFGVEENDSDRSTNRRQSLDIIQEVSQYTASVDQTIRCSEVGGSLAGSSFPVFSTENEKSEKGDASWGEKQQYQKIENKQYKTKTFLKAFRKHVDESVLESDKNGLKEITPNNNNSHETSMDDLGDTAKINIPKSIKSPKNMHHVKEKSSRKLRTLPDEDDCFGNKQNKLNYCREIKLTPQHKRNRSSSSRQKNELQTENDRYSKSHSRTSSKQKIKLASKMIEETFQNNNHRYTNKRTAGVRPSVHLGAKMHLKKITKDVRTALQEFRVWEGCRAKQVKYEGEKKNGLRWGRGKLLYDNGYEYEGSFVQNYRHGLGTISLNGIVFYEGQWSLDQLNGQGYIKSLKNYSEKCPKILNQSSYCGHLLQNKPHGMGTLFINQNEKFVGKFVHGVPVGEFTYYNHSEIQFGTWF